MTTTSGPEQPSSRFLDSETTVPISATRRHHHGSRGLLLVGGFLLACAVPSISAYPSVQLTADRQTIVVIPARGEISSRLPLQKLPTESTIAPGLSYGSQRFEQIRASPDGRYAAFSTAGHHNLIGLLDLATMAVREIDVVSEGDVMDLHWAADGRALVYDYVPATGYRRVKGYDIQSGKGLIVPRTPRNSAVHVAFEGWGPGPHEVLLRLTDGHSHDHRTETVTLIPHP